MKVAEIKKGTAEIKRGLVMMAVEGAEERCEKIVADLNDQGYPDTSCQEEGDNEGDIVIYFVIDRLEVANFRAAFRAAKAQYK
ncbi:TPA: hypothetical protein NPP60_004933 [Klebsiella variicola subsp. variicola]|nr:hypothetical protein [Klebsiella variicola subsp. variicola]